MSTKIKRTVTAVSSSSTTVTPASEATSSHQRTRSPLSPTRISRQQEKAELQHLNDRLAAYLDKVRSLEGENVRLHKEVQVSQETISREIATYRTMFEQELGDARKLLDEEATARARAEIDNKRLREENDDLTSRVDRLTKELRNLEATLNVLENRNADLQTKYNKLVSDSKKHEEELSELDKLRKTVASQKRIIENETLARIDVENKLQSLREETNFKEQVWQQEVTELRTKRREEISEVDGRLSVEYENKLQAAVRELREQNELQQQANRDEITELYEDKIKKLQAYYQRTLGDTTQKLQELQEMQQRNDVTQSQLRVLESENTSLQKRIQELEKLLTDERIQNLDQLKRLEAELVRTRDEMTEQLKEYQDLMDIKVALDLELSVYRKLLEGEEARLNIPHSAPPPRRSSSRATPSRRSGTPSLGAQALKRRRVLLEENQQIEKYQVTGEAKGDVEVSDVEPDGTYIQLRNKGDREVAIGGWQLKHVANGEEGTFKFHRSVKIEAGGTVTVWSSDSGRIHEPPVNILMKIKWLKGDTTRTVLINGDGEEVASRERQKVLTSSFLREEDGEDDIDVAETQKEQCAIM